MARSTSEGQKYDGAVLCDGYVLGFCCAVESSLLGASLQNLVAEAYRREGVVFLIGSRCVESVSKSCGVFDVGVAEVRRRSATTGYFVLQRP